MTVVRAAGSFSRSATLKAALLLRQNKLLEIRPFKLDSAAHGGAAKAACAGAALSAALRVCRPSRPFVASGNITPW